MGLTDKLKNQAENAGGKLKEAEGKATGDSTREAQGQADQTKSSLKQAGENVKDAFRS